MFLNNTEKEIFKKYIEVYINKLNMSPRDAKKIAKENIIEAKETATNDGVYDLPTDYWKEIFKMEKDNIDNDFTKYYKRAREDGVKNEDIICFWETHPVERYLLQITQNMINMNVMITALEKGNTKEEAIKKVRQNFPTYGNPIVRDEYGTEADNALPGELIFKVQEFQSLNKNPDEIKEIKNFSSFNAFIRYLAKENKLGKL